MEVRNGIPTVPCFGIGEDVITAPAGQRVCACVSGQNIVRGIANQDIIATTPNRILNDDAARNLEVAAIPVNVREGLRIEVDQLLGRLQRIVDRIVSAAIEDRVSHVGISNRIKNAACI